jgi:hypothetical protein
MHHLENNKQTKATMYTAAGKSHFTSDIPEDLKPCYLVAPSFCATWLYKLKLNMPTVVDQFPWLKFREKAELLVQSKWYGMSKHGDAELTTSRKQ